MIHGRVCIGSLVELSFLKICNILLICILDLQYHIGFSVQHSDSIVLQIIFHKGYNKIKAIIPCAKHFIPWFSYLIRSSLYLLISYPRFTPPTSFSPLITARLFSRSVSVCTTVFVVIYFPPPHFLLLMSYFTSSCLSLI